MRARLMADVVRRMVDSLLGIPRERSKQFRLIAAIPRNGCRWSSAASLLKKKLIETISAATTTTFVSR
jgi:hypothetical protein